MDNIYFHEFYGPRTGWLYRLEVYPAGDQFVNHDTSSDDYRTSKNYIRIPPGACQVKESECFGYEKYPHGLCGTKNLKVKWDLDLLPITKFAELRFAILDPEKEKIVQHPNIQYRTEQKFFAGTVYSLLIDRASSGAAPANAIYLHNKMFGETWRPFIIGIQNIGFTGGSNSETNIIEVETDDIMHYILTSLRFKEPVVLPNNQTHYVPNSLFWWEGNYGVSYVDDLFEAFYTASPDRPNDYIILSHELPNYYVPIDFPLITREETKYMMMTLTAFLRILNEEIAVAWGLLMRVGSDSSSVMLFNPRIEYLKQNMQGTGEYPAIDDVKLTYFGDINIVFLIIQIGSDTTLGFHPNTIHGGLFCEQDEFSLIKKYPCYWDFFADFIADDCSKGTTTLASINSSSLFHKNNPLLTVNIDNKRMLRYKYTNPTDKILTKCTTSFIENIDNDLAKLEVSVEGSRNKGEYNIPVLFHNLPVACDWDDKDTIMHFDPEYYVLHRKSEYWKHHIYGFYYLDIPKHWNYNINLLPHNNPVAIRVSDYCRVAVTSDPLVPGGSIWSDQLYTQEVFQPSFEPSEIENTSTRHDHCGAMLLKMQTKIGKLKMLANSFFEVYKKHNILQIEFDIIINEYTGDNDGTGKIGWIFPWMEGIYGDFLWSTFYIPAYPGPIQYKINLTDINSELARFNNEFYYLKSKIDFETETASVTLINEPQ